MPAVCSDVCVFIDMLFVNVVTENNTSGDTEVAAEGVKSQNLWHLKNRKGVEGSRHNKWENNSSLIVISSQMFI